MIESRFPETPESVASHYDDLDLFYREVWGNHVHHGYWKRGDESVEQATEALVRYLCGKVPSITAETRVCDVGCGYGETSRLIASAFGAQVTGYTVSKAQFEFARSQVADSVNPRFILGDWLENRQTDSSFDLVISIESSEHMPDIRKFFSEAYRVLRPGGRLLVCAWLSRQAPRRWEERHLLQPICTEGRLRLCTAEEYMTMMKSGGFEVESFENISQSVKKTWTICMRRFFARLLTRPEYRGFLLKSASRNKMFLNSLLRIRLAYETGSMIYGIFSARRPGIDNSERAVLS